MVSGIYVITCFVNGKVYVGSGKDLADRRSHHFSALKGVRHRNAHLQASYTKYGRGAFSFAVLEYCSVEDLIARETWWISLLDSCNRIKGYNILPPDRHELSDETRAKISCSNMGRVFTEETRRKIGAANRGKARSQELRDRISVAKRGKCLPREVVERRAASQRGVPRKPETVIKVAIANSDYYRATSPVGEVFAFRGLNQFCRENCLQASKMCLVAQGKRPHHKGWKCLKV